MADSFARPFSPLAAALDLVLCLGAFALFYWTAETHVPSENPAMVAVWSGYAAACMTGVFWIAWHMLKAVYRHQRAVATVRVED